ILGEEMPPYSIKEEYKRIKENYEKNKVFGEAVKLPFIKIGKTFKFNWLDKKSGNRAKEVAEKYGFEINLDTKIYDMSVSEKQTVEIIKVLYRGADILILDEPTAVLTPQEIDKLFAVLRRMRDDGKSIIIITHKLNEVMAVSDRVAVLRKGEHIATVKTSETNATELTNMMVGHKTDLNIERSQPVNQEVRLEIKDLSFTDHEGVKKLDDISFTAYSGEILGIAGIAGSGQRELLETIAGLIKPDKGSVLYTAPSAEKTENLVRKSPEQIRELGVRLSFVPEDRLGMGLVGNMDMIDNMMLRSYRKGHSMFVDRKNPKELAENIIKELEVSTPGVHTPVRRLSGGNVQKVLVGREIAAAPTVLMAAYPVRGLDINSSYTIYHLLNQQKEKGVAVIYVGEDLDVLIELCDRILVLCAGKISGIVDGRHTNKEEIGLLMTAESKTAGDKADDNENSAINKTPKSKAEKIKEMFDKGTQKLIIKISKKKKEVKK
ncbi:MAG TPA: ATP-binding cassette domain-containing protein, partial [Candidatus Stercoripulliclostridium merdigallinarum]|nr:ATP-binding cassette domain-containing protein [Candidatus Stercoripulliclostridium merdigallinarum]